MFVSGIALGCELTVCVAVWGGELRASHSMITQTYDFDGWVVTVTPQSTEPPARIASEATSGIQVIPASFVQENTPAKPLPLDDGAVSGLPPEPAAESIATTTDPATLSTTSPGSCGATALDALDRSRLYREVYDSIPFSRAEYNANPSYRHDATMEILFGQLRPTVVQRGETKVDVDLPLTSVSPWAYNPYGMNSLYYPFYSGRYYSGPYSYYRRSPFKFPLFGGDQDW